MDDQNALNYILEFSNFYYLVKIWIKLRFDKQINQTYKLSYTPEEGPALQSYVQLCY